MNPRGSPIPDRLAILGGGNMGSAVLQAAVRALPPITSTVIVAEPDAAKREALFEAVGPRAKIVAGTAEALARVGPGATIVLAVKPQAFPAVATEVERAGVTAPALVISIMAGVRASTIHARLSPILPIRVVRAMPNLPLALREGVTAIARGPSATDADLAFARALFAEGGAVVDLDESLLDAFTALAGSGPAYAFYLAEAMEQAAGEMGIDPGEARAIVAQTLVGAAEMLRERVLRTEDAPASPTALRAMVTSPNGTTAAATASLDRDRVREAFVRAILAARDRGRELGS